VPAGVVRYRLDDAGREGALRPGEWVLIHAGGSGVGSAATQVARPLGANISTTAGTEVGHDD
jgi:NADPH:quinone reductase-like Zn-dependent oxidoreductase